MRKINSRMTAAAGLLVSLAVVAGVTGTVIIPSVATAGAQTEAGVGSLAGVVATTEAGTTAVGRPKVGTPKLATPEPATTTPSAAQNARPLVSQPTIRRAPSTVRASAAPAPKRLQIASIGVVAAVRPVGIDRDGNVEIPKDGRQIGWYRFGSAPGDTRGSAVLVGHRDTRAQGPGALYDTAAVSVGDPIVVTRSDGSRVAYTVVERRLYEKQGLGLETFFARTGGPRLTVITCGGAYDPDNGGYQSNLIITAVPAGTK